MSLKHAIGLALIPFILFAVGCEKSLNELLRESDNATLTADEKPASESVFIGDAGERFGTDRYVLNAAAITDDTLTINVSYGGGCRTHQFTLITSDAFMESFPVQLRISLAHNANNDLCRAWLTEDYHFDLTPIKTLYQEGYRQKAGTIILRLEDAPEGNLVYEFTM